MVRNMMGATKINDYNVFMKKEIMREAFAGLLDDFLSVMKEKNISDEDKENPLTILFWQINDIYQNIIGSKYKTLEEMYEVQGQFKFFKKYIESMNGKTK